MDRCFLVFVFIIFFSAIFSLCVPAAHYIAVNIECHSNDATTESNEWITKNLCLTKALYFYPEIYLICHLVHWHRLRLCFWWMERFSECGIYREENALYLNESISIWVTMLTIKQLSKERDNVEKTKTEIKMWFNQTEIVVLFCAKRCCY